MCSRIAVGNNSTHRSLKCNGQFVLSWFLIMAVNLFSHLSCISYTFPAFFFLQYFCNGWMSMSIFIFLMISSILTYFICFIHVCNVHIWTTIRFGNIYAATYDLIIRFNACPTSINVCTQSQAKYYLCELTSITLFHVKSCSLHTFTYIHFTI